MPGVLIDDQSTFNLDVRSSIPFYDFSPMPDTLSHPQGISQISQTQQLLRHDSFSGLKDTSSNGLSVGAPVYHRSQSTMSSASLFNFYGSPPTTPKKSSETIYNSGSSLVDMSDDFSSMIDSEGSSLGGLPTTTTNSPAITMAGGNSSEVPRGYLSNSCIVGSPLSDSVSAFHKYLPSNNEDEESWASTVDVYACDQFRMFEFKVRRCMRGRSHDWTECPFAHPGEKARRRDPRRFHYSGTACPDFRKGSCRRGDACEFAHGVFECWLHPARYRTQPCKDGRNCRRRVCFFAHTPEQLRLLPAAAQAASAAARTTGGLGGSQTSPLSGAGSSSGSYDGSPGRSGVSFDGAYAFDLAAGGCASPHCQPSHGGRCQNVHGHNQNGSVQNGGCGGPHYSEQAFGSSVVGGTHAGHCCVAPQMASPTSTLVGHSASPPPLSPPLSPSGSPPMSPQSPHHWSSSPGMHQGLTQQVPFTTTSHQARVQESQIAYSQGLSSPLSRSSNGSGVVAGHAHSSDRITPAHRRHLDRLNSMPTLSIPPVDLSHRSMLQAVSSPSVSSPSSCSPPSPAGINNSAMSDLIATIQQLGLRGSSIPLWIQAQTLQAANQYSSGPSPLRRCSQSVPCTPTKLKWEERSPRWEVEENEEVEPPVQRVESGRDLRAKIYGRLGKENRADSGDAPDLGWVNELVKDEQSW